MIHQISTNSRFEPVGYSMSAQRDWPAEEPEIDQLSSSQGRRFQCKRCLKLFTKKSNLTVHERRHQELVIYKCRYCEKSLTSKWNRTRHERSHQGNLS